jgi:hypothetical protein
MALARCIMGKFLGVVCHCFPPSLDVPTFAARCIHVLNNKLAHYLGKGKAIPLQALTGPEGFRRLRLPDFKTIGT